MENLKEYLSVGNWIGQVFWTILLASAECLLVYMFGSRFLKTIKQKIISVGSLLILATFVVLAIGEVAKANHQNIEINKPDIEIAIHTCMVGKASGKIGGFFQEQKNGTSAYLELRITNHGAPSVIWKWKLTAILAGGEEISSIEELGPAATFYSQTDKAPVTPDPKRYLPMALAEEPIERGAAKIGWATFLFKDDLFSEFARPGTRFRVTVEDINGKEISCEEKLTTAMHKF